LLGCLHQASAKVIQGAATLDSMNTELFVGKFAFSAGHKGAIDGDFKVSAKYLSGRPRFLKIHASTRSLQIGVYNQAAWDKYQAAILKGSLCTDRIKMARISQSVPMHDLTKKDHEDIPFELNHMVHASETSHYWYAIVADCSLEEYDAHPPTLHYKIRFRNGGSELPADEDGLLVLNVLVLLMLLGSLFFVVRGVQASLTEHKQVHLVVLLLAAAQVLQTISGVLELAHLWQYSTDGLGLLWKYSYFPADLLSEVFQGLSEFVIQSVLIALAFGWTIAPASGQSSEFFKSLSKPHEMFSKMSAGTLFTLVQLVLQLSLELSGRVYEDDFNQFHDHEHWPGYLLMVLRLMLASLFAYGVRRTKADSIKGSDEALTRFFFRLQITGCIWFVAFPGTVVLSSWAPEYRRHGIVSVGAILTQLGALTYLMSMLLTQSDYYKVSSLRNMGTMLGTGSVRAGKVCMD